MQTLHNFSFLGSSQGGLTIGVKIESHLKLPSLRQLQASNQSPLGVAYTLGLNFNSFTLKKKNKILLTTLTSPHVHKKSREQYKIDYYKTYFLCNIANLQDYKKFLQFKVRLYASCLEQGSQTTFTYKKCFNIQGFLPNY